MEPAQNPHTHPDAINVFPGVIATYNSFECDRMHFHHDAINNMMEVHHCHFGRMGWDLNDHTSIYMGEGDVTMHSTVLCCDSSMHFPLGSYEGITIGINFDILERNVPEMLTDAEVDLDGIRKKYCNIDKSITFSGDSEIERIFAALYHKPEKQKLAYLRIKVLELLLYLDRHDEALSVVPAYNSDIIKAVEDMHNLLIQNLDTRYTIPELSAKFLINTTTLKDAFKTVYGQPIGTYMKEYRIRHAAKMLKHTDAPLSEIAVAVGYSTQSKFTQAFKESLGVLPSEYRRIRAN